MSARSAISPTLDDPAAPAPWSPFRLSVRDMMRLVVFAAVAAVALTPSVRCWQLGVASFATVVVFGAVSVPLALALAAFPLVRRGPFRDWLISTFLAIAVGVACGIATWIAAWTATHYAWRLRSYPGLLWPLIREAIGASAVALLLGVPLAFLLRRAALRRCPGCGRRTLVRQAPADRVVDRAGACFGCGARYRRRRGERDLLRVAPEEAGP